MYSKYNFVIRFVIRLIASQKSRRTGRYNARLRVHRLDKVSMVG